MKLKLKGMDVYVWHYDPVKKQPEKPDTLKLEFTPKMWHMHHTKSIPGHATPKNHAPPEDCHHQQTEWVSE